MAIPARRAVALLVVLAALVGAVVAFGALEPDPRMHAYPGSEDLADGYGDFVGDRVALGGRVVMTDPVTIAVDRPTGTDMYVLRGLSDVEPGEHVSVFATAEPDRVLSVHRAVVRPGWTGAYLHLVSVLGAALVGMLAARSWRIDRSTWCLVPREGSADG